MKHRTHQEMVSTARPRLEPVRLEFTDSTAHTVGIAGTFHDWRSPTKSMVPLGQGRWLKEMVLPPGTYVYCLIVDGKCRPDPLATETVPDPSGRLNSLLRVVSSPQPAHRIDAEPVPLEKPLH